MIEKRSWREPANGLIHLVICEPYRCSSPLCADWHVSDELLTECGISLERVHDEHDEPTCIACLMAEDLDALGEQVRQPAEAVA